MIDTGAGSPIVLVPGLQGRWEWMAPTIEALSERHRVMSFSLGSYPFSTGAHETPEGPSLKPQASSLNDPFDAWLDTIDQLIARTREPRVTLIGVSFGGLVAIRYAARRSERVGALVLVGTPSPRFSLDRLSAACVRHPRAALPLFTLRGCLRLAPEIVAARERWALRVYFALQYAGRALRHPLSPTQMAGWVRAWMAADIAGDCGRVTAPTLLITGEPGLDRVVPVGSTLEYERLIHDARHVVLAGTGHVGLVSKPHRFAELVDEFLETETSGDPIPRLRKRHAS